MKISRRTKGILTEIMAAFMLLLKGYRIISYNHKSKLGQIDIIVKKRNVIHYVEVKSKPSKFDCTNLVSTNQARRIKNSANRFHFNKFSKYEMCFDIILFRGLSVTHMKNAF